ncbi:acyloxyacyl hydrolase [Sediminitomix flava]|uniref:Lipid A 3-O-deacylase PagL n=1 Tax=Sediminitomix flava TaxID=379075 RepID=A0A315ZB29_SEDFL|nr:acyloxyacyl hydrolase [Sediminitomix flava]PWJ42751.1 lipid A 3-O-deacylase PagL [Sediminitomix flava]
MRLGVNYNKSLFFVSDRNEHLSQSIPTSIELAFFSKFSGNKDWHHDYHLPEWGITTGYYDYYSEILGRMYSLSFTFNQTLINSKKGKLTLPIQFGGVYSPSHFDIDSNPLNNAIGNTFSFLLGLAISYQYQIHPNWSLTSSLKLQHFSNGALGVPNDGINLFSPTFGINYHFKDYKVPQKANIPSRNQQKRKIYFGILGGTGLKEIRPFWDKKYMFFNLTTYLEYQIGKLSSLQLGLDAFYNLGEKADIERLWTTRALEEDIPDFKQIALLIGHELAVGKVGLVTQIGYYLYKPFENDDKFYQRVGLKYYWTKKRKIFSSLILKTHGFGASDALEWGIGYRF